MKQFSVILLLSLYILSGCNIEQQIDQNVVDYEYLSKDEELPQDVQQWLMNVDAYKDEMVHSFEKNDGVIYIYAKEHKKAKVAYIDENIDGQHTKNIKITLLKGDSQDTVFVKISYDSDLCCETQIIDDTDDEDEFYDGAR
ncbi:hypothetical protein [Bacillus sp. KH172YL63]|uniref:hypothetical protein n=1 Tax=Bacillus sp. KH172YL63 TaxID=2709784 RepID=UPI0013E4EC5C|nr:hypothetical protein [Bacillus sp. KH172YL63]BCB04033.1 hypothetical protein KH172YL63_21660 [Bacillus sp. KH172YL63]